MHRRRKEPACRTWLICTGFAQSCSIHYFASVCTRLVVQAGAYFSEQLNESLVDALLEYGEKQLVCAHSRGGIQLGCSMTCSKPHLQPRCSKGAWSVHALPTQHCRHGCLTKLQPKRSAGSVGLCCITLASLQDGAITSCVIRGGWLYSPVHVPCSSCSSSRHSGITACASLLPAAAAVLPQGCRAISPVWMSYYIDVSTAFHQSLSLLVATPLWKCDDVGVLKQLQQWRCNTAAQTGLDPVYC